MTDEKLASDRIPTTLYCDLFYANPGGADLRTHTLMAWVQHELYTDPALGLAELKTRFQNSFPGCDVSTEDVSSVCAALADASLVRVQEDQVCLADRGRRRVERALRSFNGGRTQFFRHLRSSAEEEFREYGVDWGVVESCVEDLLLRLLLNERTALRALFERKSLWERLTPTPTENRRKLGQCLAGALPSTSPTRMLRLRLALLSYIAEAAGEAPAYLDTLHRSVITSFFLIRDPYHVAELRRQLGGRTYILDTNVYLALLYRSQPRHRMVAPLLERLRANGATLAMFQATIAEAQEIERIAANAIVKAEHDSSFAQYLEANRKAIYTDFVMARREDRNLTWDLWSELHTGVEKQMQQHGIQQLSPVEFENSEDFQSLQVTLRNALKGVKEDRKNTPSDSALDHDAEVLAKLAKIQLRGEKDEWGPIHKFLSLDGGLNPALDEAGRAARKRLFFVDHPANIARILLPLDAGELRQEEYQGYVINAVQTSLGVVSELASYTDVYLIDTLEQAGLPARTLLVSGVPVEALQAAYAKLERQRVRGGGQLEQELAPIDSGMIEEMQRSIDDALAFRDEYVGELEHEIKTRDQVIASREQAALDAEADYNQRLDEVRASAIAARQQARRWRRASLAAIVLLAATILAILLLL